ncbi:MAG: hypothetical protein QM756_08230 [Polyangiaceae bacterium]
MADQSQVFGFENVSLWTASAGTKVSSTDKSQGSASLGLSNFTYAELTSATLGTLTGTSSTLLLDVKPLSVPAWGQVQLFFSIPSRGVYNASTNAVTVASLPNSAFSTLSFTLPSNVVTALGQTYSDLTIKIATNIPQSSQNFLFDNLRFQGSTASSVVEMRISNPDDYLYVTVNGIRRKVAYIGDPANGTRIPISDWFGAGNNSVRIQNVNTGGPSTYQFELWVDGTQVVNDSAPSGLTTEGIAVDKTFTLNTPNRPAFKTVSFTSSTAGKLYVNGVYTGQSTPSSLTLPQGSYTFGLGVSTDAPFSYTGSFYEQATTVGASTSSVNMTASAALPLQKTSSIVVVPVQNTYNYVTSLGRADVSNNGVLNASDVTTFAGQINATRDTWFKPFSYNLATWSVTVLPMVTSTPLNENSPDGLDLDQFLTNANLNSLRTQYDRIVVYFSQQRANGTDVADPYGAVFALGRQLIGFQRSYSVGTSSTTPNPYFLHESLHNQEAYNADILHNYNGVSGLHGANQHGYYDEGSSGETDFIKYYRAFMRGTLADLDSFRPNVNYPSIPTTSDMYTGVFQTLRVYTGY